MNKRAEVYAVVNQKGGIGKTTTTINLCKALQEKGYKTAIIEMDPQGNAATALGFTNVAVTTKDILLKICTEEEIVPEYGLLHSEEDIDLIPALPELSGMEYVLYELKEKGRTALKQYIRIIEKAYDYIFIDCPPFLGLLSANALIAADSVIIPILAEPLPTQGLQQLLKTIFEARKKSNPTLQVAGILLMNVDMRTANTISIIEQIRAAYQNKINVFKTQIPRRIAVSEAQGVGKSVITYEPKNDASKAFMELAEEIIHG